AVPFVDSGGEGEAAFAAGRDEFFEPLAQAEGHGPQVRASLANAKAQVPLAAADSARLADKLQAAGQEARPRIVRAIWLKWVDFLKQPESQSPARHFSIEMQGRRRQSIGKMCRSILAEHLAEGIDPTQRNLEASRSRMPAVANELGMAGLQRFVQC